MTQQSGGTGGAAAPSAHQPAPAPAPQPAPSQPSQQQSEAAPTQPITTQAELDQRIAQRPTPAPEMHHTIGGEVETAAHRQVNAENESRIAHLKTRLERVREGAQRDHVFAAQEGRAKTDFGRSR